AFLGLAEIRLKQNRTDEAVNLLNRLNLLSTVPFENLLPSARVLSAAGHPAEAAEFLKLRIQAVPWDSESRLELGRVQMALGSQQAAGDTLQQVVGSSQAPYAVRSQAAREQGTIGRPPAATTGSRELDLLSGKVPLTPEAADAPYFFAARV